MKRFLGAMTLVLAGAAALAQTDATADFRKRLDAARQQMDSDIATAMQALDVLAEESIRLRQTRALTEAERGLHRDLFLARARAHLQLLENEKVDEDFRQLLKVEPVFKGSLNPLEQELLDSLRRREGGSVEIMSGLAGSKVYVNGVEAGVTGDAPLRVALLSGDYDIRVEKEGFQATSVKASVPRGETVALPDLTPSRRVPPVAFVADREGVEVVVDKTPVGKTVALSTLRSQLSTDESAALDRAASSAGFGASAAAILLRQPSVDRAMAVRFQRDCFVEVSRNITITSDKLATTTTDPILWLGDTSAVRMQTDTGRLKVTSSPSDADVFIDNQLLGRTPFERDICTGERRIRVRHRIGSYTASAMVRRGGTEVIDAVLKPSIAFLGSVDAAQGTLRPFGEFDAAIRRALGSALTTFRLTDRSEFGMDMATWSDATTAELVAAYDRNDSTAVTRLLRQASETYDAPLLVTAVRRAGGDAPVDLLVFWSDHPGADRVPWVPAKQPDPGPLVSKFDSPADVADLTHESVLGMRVADTVLSESPLMVVHVEPHSPAATAGMQVGDSIALVDGAAMNATQLAERLARKKPGDLLTFHAVRAGSPSRQVPIPVQQVPKMAPVFESTYFGNAMLAKLAIAQVTATNEGDRALYAFNLALARMRFREWRAALDVLNALPSPPIGIGVGPAAVAFFKARCYEELGEADRAVGFYREAASMEGQMMTRDGTTVASLARRRLASLGRPASPAEDAFPREILAR